MKVNTLLTRGRGLISTNTAAINAVGHKAAGFINDNTQPEQDQNSVKMLETWQDFCHF